MWLTFLCVYLGKFCVRPEGVNGILSNITGKEGYFYEPGTYTIKCFDGYSIGNKGSNVWRCEEGNWEEAPECIGK